MTNTQIAFWNYREAKRHNIAYEVETNRHNLATERLGTDQLGEGARHNRVTESQTDVQLKEQKRHNKRTEKLDAKKAKAGLDQAKASLQQAKAALKNAKTNKEKVKWQKRIDTLELQVKRAQTALKAAEVEVKKGELKVKQSEAKARIANLAADTDKKLVEAALTQKKVDNYVWEKMVNSKNTWIQVAGAAGMGANEAIDIYAAASNSKLRMTGSGQLKFSGTYGPSTITKAERDRLQKIADWWNSIIKDADKWHVQLTQ